MENQEYSVELDVIYNKITKEYCWVHTRGGVIPGDNPIIVTTTQKWFMGKSDIFSGIYHFKTSDMGKSWEGPTYNKELDMRGFGNGLVIGICDQTPAYHKNSGKLLSTGHTLLYDGGDHPASALDMKLPIFPSYTVYNERTNAWSKWKIIEEPGIENSARVSAGCSQRFDLEDGTILLPVSYLQIGGKHTKITVIKCSFDGVDLKPICRGNSLEVNSARGLAEASITRFKNTYYLTIRHDDKGYVCRSSDGLNFSMPETWKWDTGIDVKTYNTQSHWITHSGGLYLAYTRDAGNNSHVFRHRAPLFMSKVDPDRMCLMRHTEQILIPERGARLGNFNTVNINDRETWVFNTEVLSPPDCVKYGCDGSIYVAKIKWKRPNKLIR
ncbi:MAG: exo-alpha-sialidase [Clostridia bacterium]|nr:exo-alpha-sialidase [Clostridia bacterium]